MLHPATERLNLPFPALWLLGGQEKAAASKKPMRNTTTGGTHMVTDSGVRGEGQRAAGGQLPGMKPGGGLVLGLQQLRESPTGSVPLCASCGYNTPAMPAPRQDPSALKVTLT